MALVESIDTLDYDALVSEAQRRIIARSRGAWTLHAPVDPGITLIELFAWLLDQRSYWAAQTSGDFGRAIMRLLGQHALPARAAVAPITSTDRLVAGQPLRFAHPASLVTFTVETELDPLPLAPTPLAVRVDGKDLAADLRARRSIELLHAGSETTTAELDLVLSAALGADHPVSLAILIDTGGAIAPEWSPEAVDVAPPTPLAFAYRAGTAWKPLAVTDGTLGLRRSGLVRFTLPADATPNGTTYTISITAAEPTFTASPIVTDLCLNATTAKHQQPRAISIAIPPLPLPGRTIELPSPPIEDSVTLSLVEADGVARAWTQTADFTTAKPDDRVFVVDRLYACLRFGDGLAGRLPYIEPTSTAVTGSYLEGGGVAGNVGTGSWTGTGVAAKSIAAATGGRETETLAAAQLRAADELHVRTRAATREDYAVIATTTPGVAIARAYAAINFDPGEPCIPAPGVVTVFVLPGVAARTVDDLRVPAPVADPGALAAVQARFATTRLLGTQVLVQSVPYRDIDLRIQIAGDPWDPAATRESVESALRAHLDPLLGGSDAHGWPFGEPLRPSDLMRVVQNTIDGDGEVIRVGITRAGTSESTCNDVVLAAYELPRIRSIQVRITPQEVTA